MKGLRLTEAMCGMCELGGALKVSLAGKRGPCGPV